MTDVNAALTMIGAFVDIGVTNFDLSVVEHVVMDDNKTYDVKVPGRQLTNAHFRELHFRIGKMLREAEESHFSLIVRPRPLATDLLVQLDDLNAEKVEKVKAYSFLIVRTSARNFQAWIAVSDAPRDKKGGEDLAGKAAARCGC